MKSRISTSLLCVSFFFGLHYTPGCHKSLKANRVFFSRGCFQPPYSSSPTQSYAGIVQIRTNRLNGKMISTFLIISFNVWGRGSHPPPAVPETHRLTRDSGDRTNAALQPQVISSSSAVSSSEMQLHGR